MEDIKKQIIDKIVELESSKKFAEILKLYRGVPVGLLLIEINNPKALQKAIYELWKDGEITIQGTLSQSLNQEERELLSAYLEKDIWFSHGIVALYRQEK